MKHAKCLSHPEGLVKTTENLWSATNQPSTVCAYGCHGIEDKFHHCERLHSGNIVNGYKLYRSLHDFASSIQPTGCAVALTKEGPVVRVETSGVLGQPSSLQVYVPSHTVVALAKIAYMQPGGKQTNRWSLVLPNTQGNVPIFPAHVSTELITGKISVSTFKTIHHDPKTGWPLIDGWKYEVIQAVMDSGCAKKRWHCISGDCQQAPLPKRQRGYTRKILLRRTIFNAHGAPAIVDVNTTGTVFRCAYCQKQYNNFYMFIGKCAPDCSKQEL